MERYVISTILFLSVGLALLSGCPYRTTDPVPDTMPVPGNGGLVSCTGAKPTSVTLSWAKASDDGDAALLQYLVYFSDSNLIDTVEKAEIFGTACGTYETDVSSKEVTSLSESTVYNFAVIVKDPNDNKACYGMITQTTEFSALVLDLSTSDDEARAIACDSNSIYIGCWKGYGYGKWHIEKRDKNTGITDQYFGTNGVVESAPTTDYEWIKSMALDANYLYVGGWQTYSGDSYHRWKIEKRDKVTGALVSSFGTAGIVRRDFSTGDDRVQAVRVDANYVYAAGNDYSAGNWEWRIEKYDKVTGALVTDFDTDGIYTLNPSASNETIYDMEIDSSYVYLIGEDYSPGDCQWRIEKLDKMTGAGVTDFGTDGIIVSNPGTGADTPYAIAIDPNYLYAAGKSVTPPSTWHWRIEKRDIATGALVSTFGSSGVVESFAGATIMDNLTSVGIDVNYLYVAGVDYTGSDYKWRLEKHDIVTGAAVTGFGTNGIVTSNPTANNDYLRDAIIDTNYVYLCGQEANARVRLERRDISTGGLP